MALYQATGGSPIRGRDGRLLEQELEEEFVRIACIKSYFCRLRDVLFMQPGWSRSHIERTKAGSSSSSDAAIIAVARSSSRRRSREVASRSSSRCPCGWRHRGDVGSRKASCRGCCGCRQTAAEGATRVFSACHCLTDCHLCRTSSLEDRSSQRCSERGEAPAGNGE